MKTHFHLHCWRGTDWHCCLGTVEHSCLGTVWHWTWGTCLSTVLHCSIFPLEPCWEQRHTGASEQWCRSAGGHPWNHNYSLSHRRSIKTEEKVKVIAVVWGKEFIQFLLTLTFFHQGAVKKEMISSYSSYCSGELHPNLQIVLVQNCKNGKKCKQYFLQAAATTFAFSSVCILFLWVFH